MNILHNPNLWSVLPVVTLAALGCAACSAASNGGTPDRQTTTASASATAESPADVIKAEIQHLNEYDQEYTGQDSYNQCIAGASDYNSALAHLQATDPNWQNDLAHSGDFLPTEPLDESQCK